MTRLIWTPIFLVRIVAARRQQQRHLDLLDVFVIRKYFMPSHRWLVGRGVDKGILETGDTARGPAELGFLGMVVVVMRTRPGIALGGVRLENMTGMADRR